MQFERPVGEKRVLSAGSVGMPYGLPGAYWLRLGPGVEVCHTLYDLETAARQVRRTSYPYAEECAQNILRPPSESEALGVFELCL
jgi:hypothetical protein